nr:uncharacterized protein [Drosophila biauraria male killing partitivirus 1]
MPRPRSTPKRKRNFKRVIRRSKRVATNRSSKQMAVHRRVVLFPDVTDAKWLKSLAWFASVALKLFSLITGVSDDLIGESVNVGSGSVILLGPGDFAAFSPVAIPVSTTKPDKEVKCLKAFPYERANLLAVTIKIVPSVDFGARGGMYAACLIPVDSIDSTLVGQASAKQILARYSSNYDDIIKNPRAKMGPVDKMLSLSLRLQGRGSNIRIQWDSDTGFINTYPTCALIVAFSDLAAKETAVATGYAPNKSLFEVHMTGNVVFSEPGEITIEHNTSDASMSCYTPKLLTTNSQSINTSFFNHRFETTDGRVDLRTIDVGLARTMLEHYDRRDLIPKLLAESNNGEVMDFEKLEV